MKTHTKMEHQSFRATVTSEVREGTFSIMPLDTKSAGYNDMMIVHTQKTEFQFENKTPATVESIREGIEIEVTTNGIMTMSLPPQINPLAIKILQPKFTFEANVLEVTEVIRVAPTETGEMPMGPEVIVRIAETSIINGDGKLVTIKDIKNNDELIIEYNGMMTRSLPPQINATKISIK